MKASTMISYVLAIVFDPRRDFVVGLTKRKGPEFLRNRLTFPGGKLEAGEDPAVATSREFAEECGVTVPPEAWLPVTIKVEGEATVHVFTAISERALQARTMEEEPIWQLAVARHLQYATRQPAQYAPDFLHLLNSALSVHDMVARPADELLAADCARKYAA